MRSYDEVFPGDGFPEEGDDFDGVLVKPLTLRTTTHRKKLLSFYVLNQILKV